MSSLTSLATFVPENHYLAFLIKEEKPRLKPETNDKYVCYCLYVVLVSSLGFLQEL